MIYNYLFVSLLLPIMSAKPAVKTSVENVIQKTYMVVGYSFATSSPTEVLLTLDNRNGTFVLLRWSVKQQSNPRLPSKDDGYGERLIPLNPQNAMAVNYNYTHVVKATLGDVYLNINQVR